MNLNNTDRHMKMTHEFILERLEVIGGSAPERETGNETIDRMFSYLASHKAGNEESMRVALSCWLGGGAEPKASIARTLLKELAL